MSDTDAELGLIQNWGNRFGIGDEIRADLSRALEKIHLAKGELAFEVLEPCSSVLFLEKGVMRSFTTNEGGDEITYFLFFDQDFVCDFRSLVTRKPSRFRFEALEQCTAERLSAIRLAALLKRHPVLQEVVRIVVEEAYVQLDRRVESLLLQSATQRYRNFKDEYQDRVSRIPQYVIASYLGLRPESLSRIKGKIGKP